jgi:NitT/TauT family transport system substrate-binding protein
VRTPLIDAHDPLSRREFLRVAASVGAVGAGAVLLGACGSDESKGRPTSTPGIVVDPPPETTTIRLGKSVTPCQAPLHLAEQFLPAEGFTTVQYFDEGSDIGRPDKLAAGEIDMDLILVQDLTAAADAGDQLVILGGVVNSVFELFGNDRVQSLRDLKGKRIWAYSANDATSSGYRIGYTEALLAYVGVARSEVEYVELSVGDGLQQFEAGAIDAIAVAAPGSTALRIKNIGHVVLDGAMDPPWSQYFGGMATANRDFAEKHPAATKRALRAILKAADLCAREPERAARYLVDKGDTPYTYDFWLETITGLSYAAWREFNPEDTMRFYALRLKEAGIVKSTPDELIARGTDWRYLDEIKRELGVA